MRSHIICKLRIEKISLEECLGIHRSKVYGFGGLWIYNSHQRLSATEVNHRKRISYKNGTVNESHR